MAMGRHRGHPEPIDLDTAGFQVRTITLFCRPSLRNSACVQMLNWRHCAGRHRRFISPANHYLVASTSAVDSRKLASEAH